jgi:chromate reductase, NAD(P)H dehydrogenase (quinone)
MTTILGISGSLRHRSFNTGLLVAAREFMPDGVSLEVHSLRGIPLYDQDLMDESGHPEPVQELREALRQTDGLLLATPEYNHGIPAVPKNAIDWASRPASEIPELFADLPVGIIGAGGLSGTRFAQTAWLPTLRVLGTRPWFGKGFYATGAGELFDETGALADEETRDLLRDYVKGFAAFCVEQPRRRTPG